MRAYNLTMVVLLCCFTATNVGAAAIGASENTARIGYGFGFGSVSVSDPQGNVENDTAPQLLQLIYTDRWFQEYRYWGEIFVDDSEHKAGIDQIGQEVDRFGVRAIVHRQLHISDNYNLWAGGGLQIAQEKSTLRHTVDSDGFLLQSFGDRKHTSLALAFDVINEWHINSRWDVGGRLRYSLALGDGIDDLAASVVFLYRFQE